MILTMFRKYFTLYYMLMTHVFYQHENVKTQCTFVSNEPDNLSSWLALNKLPLNVLKTKYMIFPTVNNTEIRINGLRLEEIYSIKFLGVCTDHIHSWKNHFAHTSSK